MERKEAIELGITEALWNTSLTSWDIAAFERALAEHGYAVVPLEPTPEMLKAFADACDEHGHCLVKYGYREMVLAASRPADE